MINDLGCNSEGGNITASISDHFLQFSFCDVFGKVINKDKEYKFKINFRNFKHNEFLEELHRIDWNEIMNDEADVNCSFDLFYNKIESLLNIMAPIKKNVENACNRDLGSLKVY